MLTAQIKWVPKLVYGVVLPIEATMRLQGKIGLPSQKRVVIVLMICFRSFVSGKPVLDTTCRSFPSNSNLTSVFARRFHLHNF